MTNQRLLKYLNYEQMNSFNSSECIFSRLNNDSYKDYYLSYIHNVRFFKERSIELDVNLFIDDLAFASIYEIRDFCRELMFGPFEYIKKLLSCLHIESRIEKLSEKQQKNKLHSRKWLARQLREMRGVKQENISAKKKEVGANTEYQYISPSVLANYNLQKTETQKWLENTKVWSFDGRCATEVSLSKFAQTEKQRKAQINSDSLVVELKAKNAGYETIFGTITPPGHHHFNPANGNCTWSGTTSRESYKYQYDAYRAFYNRMKEDEIELFGMRVVEVHKDGTPHIHVALFCDPSDRKSLVKHWNNAMSDYEINSVGHKLKFEEDLPEGAEKQSATTYVMKYITKGDCLRPWFGIDNGGLVRQFSTFGIDSYKSKWNLLYKARHELSQHKSNVFKSIYTLITDEERNLEERKLEFATVWAQRLIIIRKETENCYEEKVKTKIIGIIDKQTLDVFRKPVRILRNSQIKKIFNSVEEGLPLFAGLPISLINQILMPEIISPNNINGKLSLAVILSDSRKALENKNDFNISDDPFFNENFDNLEKFDKINYDLLIKETETEVDFDIF
ncbi:replication endonuclease [Neptuniibacter pectenicola]|uniref:Replication endonuclease n=1 Tax=Neptuniibacter pectenicola TaxID=1806669 RepID=A0ABU9TXM7_9GAMM